jgi:hypothetical protein
MRLRAEECLSNSKAIKETLKDVLEKLNTNKENTAIFDDITILGLDFFI